MRIGIVGLGWVGASTAISILHRGIARELWLDDVRDGLAQAEALDLAHGASFYPPCAVRQAPVAEMAVHCDAIVIAAGKGALPGQSRLDALTVTAGIARDLGHRLRGAKGIVVVVTNPVDVMTQLIAEASGLPAARVIGSGTVLDTSRLRHVLAQRLRIDERSVHAYVLGEHGDSQVAVWSSAMIGGVPLRRLPGWQPAEEPKIAESVRKAAYEIVAKKGATNHAIGLVTATLLQSVLRDERRLLTVSRVHAADPATVALLGGDSVALSLPTVVGKGGAEQVLLPELDAAEVAALGRSASLLRKAYDSVPKQDR
jgi:L-lactate dehydrogenase